MMKNPGWLKMLLFIALYFAACLVVFIFPKSSNELPYIWPATGIGLAILIISDHKRWHGLLLGLFIAGTAANLLMGQSFFFSIIWMSIQSIEIFACAFLIHWWTGNPVSFSKVEEISALICASTLVNGLIGLLGAGLYVVAYGASFGYCWQTWWITHSASLLILTPFLIIWNLKDRNDFLNSRLKIVEIFLFFIIWVAASFLSFKPDSIHRVFMLQPYMLMAIITWAAFRLGQRVLSGSLLLVYVISLFLARLYNPVLLWGGESPLDRLLLAQIFLGFLAATSLMLSASFRETCDAEKKSREENQRIRAIGDNLPGGMVYQTLVDENGKTHFTYVSAGVEKLNGVPAEEILKDANALYDLVLKEDREQVFLKKKEALENLTPFNVVIRMRHKDGQIRWIHITSSPRKLDDGRIIWDGIQMDITERKKAEEEIRALNSTLEQRVHERTAQLIASNQELESFSYAVSHDLRSPLRAINGFSHILREDYGSNLDETASRYFDQIFNATRRMGLLIDELLKLSRITRSEIQYRKIDLCNLARDIYEMLRIQYPARNVRLEMPKHMVVLADRALMQIVLDNLIKNAWKFTLHNPQACIQLGSRKKGKQTIFFVRDNGVGFDMAYSDKLFGAFQRLHSEREFDGTGIGLAMVQRVISRHGGAIWAEGIVGEGATFYFTLE